MTRVLRRALHTGLAVSLLTAGLAGAQEYPNRIIRIRLTPGGLAVASVETLLANGGGMGDPTLGVVAGNRFFFNGKDRKSVV